MEPKNGLYRHFKGNIYEVIGVATEADTKERMVVYKDTKTGNLYVRKIGSWSDPVREDVAPVITDRFVPMESP